MMVKTIWIWITMILVPLPLQALNLDAKSFSFSEVGFDLFYGRGETSWNQKLSSSDWQCDLLGGLLKTGKYLSKDLGLKIEAGLGYRYHRAFNDSRTRYGHEVNIELALRKEFILDDFLAPYFGIVGGFSSMFPGDQPKLGNSGILATAGFLIGYEYPISTTWKLHWELRWKHSSDPIRDDDSGRNWEEVRFGFVKEF